jgi:hypothetical protein
LTAGHGTVSSSRPPVHGVSSEGGNINDDAYSEMGENISSNTTDNMTMHTTTTEDSLGRTPGVGRNQRRQKHLAVQGIVQSSRSLQGRGGDKGTNRSQMESTRESQLSHAAREDDPLFGAIPRRLPAKRYGYRRMEANRVSRNQVRHQYTSDSA